LAAVLIIALIIALASRDRDSTTVVR
jgi:hypothetical protein